MITMFEENPNQPDVQEIRKWIEDDLHKKIEDVYDIYFFNDTSATVQPDGFIKREVISREVRVKFSKDDEGYGPYYLPLTREQPTKVGKQDE